MRTAVISAIALSAIAGAIVASGARTTTVVVPPIPKLAQDLDRSAGRAGAGADAFTWEAEHAAALAYPASIAPVGWAERARATFDRLERASRRVAEDRAASRRRGHGTSAVTDWSLYGPRQIATVPGILDPAGAGYQLGSRVVALAMSSSCTSGQCTVYAGTSGGGVWKTANALAANPLWTPVSLNAATPSPWAQQTIGDIVIDPNDVTEQTIWVGTGEPNSCSSGCSAGVGLYRSTDGGSTWSKVAAACTSNLLYTCASPGDAFLGRGIGEIVIAGPNHVFVGSASAVRSISHVIGLGGQVRNEPGANRVGLYESTDNGATFEAVWLPQSFSRGVIDVGVDPTNHGVVYASAFDVGLWRRCPDAVEECGFEPSAGKFDFKQIFAPRMPNTERTMFDLTTLPSHGNATRIYLTTGRFGQETTILGGESSSSLWRADNANQTSAVLRNSEPPSTGPAKATCNPYPTLHDGWQILTHPSLASPCWASHDFCTVQCWFDQDVYTPPGRPDEVYLLGSYSYGEVPCYTKGANPCGTGISNGREILFSDTAGDRDVQHGDRTFTDLTWDAQNVPASWCAYPSLPQACRVAHNGQHHDGQEILVNPSNPAQFVEASDGGIVHSDGQYFDLSEACAHRGIAPGSNAETQCRRLLSRVPTTLTHTNRALGSTLQFIGVAANPLRPCEVIGGTQDNGTWMPRNCDTDEWLQKIYGDGGNAGFDAHPDEREVPTAVRQPGAGTAAASASTWVFNSFVSPYTDANFRGGDPTAWVVVSGPIFNSPNDQVGFYHPQIADPNPPLVSGARTHPIFIGQRHVWRSWAFGAGHLKASPSTPQDVVPDIPYYEANCPEFFVGQLPGCGDFRALATSSVPAVLNDSGDLTGSFWSGGSCAAVAGAQPRCGGGVSWLSRRRNDTDTMWVTTSAGRVFVTFNANDADPSAVQWHRVDNLPGSPSCTSADEPNCSPTRVPTGIYPDASNTNVAYLSYTGYNQATPPTPGHVFRVTLGMAGNVPTSASFVDLHVEGALSAFPTPTSSGDLPVNDVVMDDATGDLYAATDFGVLRGAAPSYTWSVTTGMPRYLVTHLALVGGQRDACRADIATVAPFCGKLLYAATHSRGIWVARLSTG